MRTCAECRATVRQDANFCAACGTFLGWHEDPSPRPAQRVAPVPAPGPHGTLRAPATPAPPVQREHRAHGVVLVLSEEAVELQPGATAQASLRICNTGQVVDEFGVRVIGVAAGWTEVEPPQVAVYPQAEQTVTLRFRPPRAPTVPAGRLPVTVVAQSALHAQTSASAVCVLDIAAYDELSAVLVPQQAEGRGRSQHRFIITNRGNDDEVVELPGQDRQGGVRVLARPAVVSVAPGADAVVGIEVRSGWRWRGEPRQHPFTVRARARDGIALSGSGTSVQHRLLPAWAQRLLLLALLALAALLAWRVVAGDVQVLAGTVTDALSSFGRDVAQIWDNLKDLGDDQQPPGTPDAGLTDQVPPEDG